MKACSYEPFFNLHEWFPARFNVHCKEIIPKKYEETKAMV